MVKGKERRFRSENWVQPGVHIPFIHSCSIHITYFILKADRPPPHDYLIHRQTTWTDNDVSVLFSALGKAEPLISTAAHQKFDLDL